MGVGEEREICFEENGIITLKKGIVICVEGDKFKVVSGDRKEVTYFDNEGKFIDKHPTVAESHGYTDFGCLKYFEKMDKKERKKVKHWFNSQKANSAEEETFLSLVDDAIKFVQYGYHISTITPSYNGNQIYFNENSEPYIELERVELIQKAKEFAPQYKSRLASLFEIYYWCAYKIATGECTWKEIDKIQKDKRIVLREV